MAGLEIIFPVSTVFNLQSADKTMADINSAFSKAAQSFKLDPGALRGGQNLVDTMLGGKENFTKMIDEAATGVGKLTTTFANVRDKADATGKVFQFQTGQVTQLSGVLGGTQTITKNFAKEQEHLNDMIKSGRWVVESYSNQVATMAASERFEGETLKQVEKELVRYSDTAVRLESQLKNMRGSQVTTARGSIQVLRDEIKTFQELAQSGKATKTDLERLEQAFKDMNVAVQGTKAGANVFQNFATRIGNAIQQTIAYSLSLGLVYKAQKLLNDAIKYSIDLNTEMVKIQVLQAEGARTPEEINALAESFNKLGQEMAASTLEIAQGSVEWFRQGRTVKETGELMRSSLMLGKLGAMSAADATNYLTSITNAFKISAEDAVGVVDKLIAVDNIAATSAGELATAMRYTSESAAIAGVSMDQLVAYIGTVSTVTRQNAEMIGQAFKTMFARMTLIEGGGVDEDNMTISKVEKVLKKVNITMRNSQGNFRNMGDVLEDIAGKWDTLAERERMEIAIAVGGVRQKEPFLVLMNNMDKALQYQTEETNAAGLAQERYGIYLESVEAKQAKLTAAMQELYSTTVNSGMVAWFLDAATAGANLISSMGGIPPLLVEIIALMVAFNKTSIADTLAKSAKNVYIFVQGLVTLIRNQSLAVVSTETFAQAEANAAKMGMNVTDALALMGYEEGTYTIATEAAATATSILASAINVLALAITGAMIIWQLYQKHLDNVKKAAEEARQANQDFIDSLNSFPEQAKGAEEVFLRIRELEAKGKKRKPEEEEELVAAYNELYKIVPNLKYSFDDLGNAVLDAGVSMADLQEKTIDFYITSKAEGTTLPQYFADYAKEVVNARNNIKQLTKDQNLLNNAMTEGNGNLVDAANAYIDMVEAQKTVVYGAKGATTVYTASAEQKEIAEKLKQALKDNLSASDLAKIFSDAITKASGEIANDKSTIDSSANEFKKMYAMVYGKATPAFIQVQKTMWEEAQKDPALLAAIDEVAYEHAKEYATQWESSKWQPVIEPEIDLSEDFKSQLEIIDALSPALTTLSTALTSTSENSQEVEDAVLGLNDSLAKLAADKNIDVPIKSFNELKNAAGDALNPKRVETYRLSLIQWMKTNADVLISDQVLYNSVMNRLNALTDASNEAVYKVSDASGNIFNLTASKFQQYVGWLGEMLWNLYGTGKTSIEMVANDGTTIIVHSASEITSVLSQMYGQFTNYIIDATNTAAGAAAGLSNTLSGILKGLSGKKPYFLPEVPFGGTGGGGGTEKDPRIKALEDKIKKEQDAIDDLKWEIELYNRQKEAIDRLIEAENRKKDALDRQIAIYQRQIDSLDRQIELYNRQKDAIDRIIDGYEKQKDAIDKLIDQQEELKKPIEDQKKDLDARLKAFKEYIDLQKESLERMKDEADYLDELRKKTRDVAKVQAELALASLDTSEEGQNRRLKLEEELANKQEDLTQFTEDRKYDLQIRALEDTYKAFEDTMNKQKALLDDQLAKIQEIIDGYNSQKDAIDALIEPLNLQKEAIDALILPLEDQKTALEDLIYPLEQQKEAIDLVIQGYEDEKTAIDDLIQPIEDQIQLMEDRIRLWEKEKEAIQEVIDALGGSGGGPGSLYGVADETNSDIATGVQFIIDKYGVLLDQLGLTKDKITEMVSDGIDKYGKLSLAVQAVIRDIEHMREVESGTKTNERINRGSNRPGGGPKPKLPPGPYIPGHDYGNIHQGGLAEQHHEGEFAGGLKTNEVFAKLLKGEYVATEAQMKEFFRSTLPSMAKEISSMYAEEDRKKTRERTNKLDIIPTKIISPPKRPSSEIVKPINYGKTEDYNKYGDINFDMNITVQGTLDKTVLPQLKKSVIKEINKSLEKRGIKRTADNFAI